MAWLYLIAAGLFEIGWPVGLKMSQTPGRLVFGVVIAVACMTASGILLWLAQRTIPIGGRYFRGRHLVLRRFCRRDATGLGRIDCGRNRRLETGAWIGLTKESLLAGIATSLVALLQTEIV